MFLKYDSSKSAKMYYNFTNKEYLTYLRYSQSLYTLLKWRMSLE